MTSPRADCSMMFQSPLLLPWRTVRKNVLLPIEILGRDPKDYRDRATALLEMVGVEGFADHYPRELSGGMQQRVAICRALTHEPEVLLLDEPFAALDSITREQLNDDLLRIWAGTGCTIVLVTHNVDEAVYLSNRVLVFSDRPGRIVDELAIDLPSRAPTRCAARRPIPRDAGDPADARPREGPARGRVGGGAVRAPPLGCVTAA